MLINNVTIKILVDKECGWSKAIQVEVSRHVPSNEFFVAADGDNVGSAFPENPEDLWDVVIAALTIARAEGEQQDRPAE